MLKSICLIYLILGAVLSFFSNYQVSYDGIVRGRVTDLFGVPVSGCVVEVSSEDSFNRSIITDARGEYFVERIPTGYVTIVFKSRGFKQEHVRIYLNESEEVVDIGLEAGQITPLPPIEISGVIKDVLGNPVNGASVSISSIFNPRIKTTARSDRSGRYKIKTSITGKYLLIASKPGFQTGVSKLNLKPANSVQRYTTDLILVDES